MVREFSQSEGFSGKDATGLESAILWLLGLASISKRF